MKLSIIIPVYNEEETINNLITKVKKVRLGNIQKEIIIINDGSTDRTPALLTTIKGCTVLSHEKNLGKGAAFRTALKHATGDIVLIQDADLEYFPHEYHTLLNPIIKEKANVVYGSRRLIANPKSGPLYTIGGILATHLTNLLYHTTLTDIATGYKVFTRKALENIHFNENGFAFEPELTILLAQKSIKINEVPIHYHPRTKTAGKKVRLHHSIAYFSIIIKKKWS